MGMRKKRRGGECTAKIKLDEAGNFLQRINNQTMHQVRQRVGKRRSGKILKEEQQRLKILLKLY